MIKLAIRLGMLTPILLALSTAPSLTPVFAAGGGGGGGGGGEASSAMNPGPSYPPSSYPPSYYPKRWGTKTTHKAKKTNKQSSIDDPAFAQGYRAAMRRSTTATTIPPLSSS